MIAALRGTVLTVAAGDAVIEAGGVGYLVQASTRTLSALVAGEAAALLVETQVRADSITLFGFRDAAERDAFRALVGVQGVGGRLALAILSTLAPAELARALATEDRAMIARAPGVGAKLAARLVTELKGAMPAFAGAAGPVAQTGRKAADALAALAGLGFRGAEAAAALAAAEAELGADPPLAELVRRALRKAAR